jgi:hypothetical protein
LRKLHGTHKYTASAKCSNFNVKEAGTHGYHCTLKRESSLKKGNTAASIGSGMSEELQQNTF